MLYWMSKARVLGVFRGGIVAEVMTHQLSTPAGLLLPLFQIFTFDITSTATPATKGSGQAGGLMLCWTSKERRLLRHTHSLFVLLTDSFPLYTTTTTNPHHQQQRRLRRGRPRARL